MEPRIETIPEKKLIGKRLTMSLANNRTGELWKSFMPRRNEIQNNIGTELYSLQIVGLDYFKKFDPTTEFEKWATIEVTNFDTIPSEMESLRLVGGLYAVFPYKGLHTDTSIFQYIYSSWLPNSSYLLDNRPQFEILGDKYKNDSPDSEEEIWIPVKPRN